MPRELIYKDEAYSAVLHDNPRSAYCINRIKPVDAVVLPCKIDDDVYIIPSKVNFELNVLCGLEKNNRVYHQKVGEIVFLKDCWYVSGNADKEYGTGRVLLDSFYRKTWFLTEEEAQAALGKMDGGNENAER